MNKEQCINTLNDFYDKENKILKVPTMIFIGELKLHLEKALGYAIDKKYISFVERSKNDFDIEYEIYEVLEDDIFIEREKEKIENLLEKYKKCETNKELINLIDKDIKILMEKLDILKANIKQ